MERAAAKRSSKPFTTRTANGLEPTITLANPVSHLFGAFVVANALTVEALMHDALIGAAPDAAAVLEPYDGVAGLFAAMKRGEPTGDFVTQIGAMRAAYDTHVQTPHVVRENSHDGKTLAICGAGPSLRDELASLKDHDDVWGCNSALPWLLAQGVRVTHGFTVDQTPAMVNEWATAPDVGYVVPSTIHPHLTEHLVKAERRLTWFHNYVGIKGPTQSWQAADGLTYTAEYEDWLYYLLYPATFRAGSGLNTVTRALDVACFMGYDRITVYGADCALRVSAPRPDAPMGSPAYLRWLEESTQMHADGGHALASGATAVTMTGAIDGREWTSKPDLLISAVWMEKMRRNQPDRIFYVGDTLPNALREKSETFLMRLPALVDSSGNAIMVPDVRAMKDGPPQHKVDAA